MTLNRLRESRAETNLERRSGMQSAFIGGYNLVDPAAIPPPGMQSLSRAGVQVTPHSLLLVDVVFTALRIISNNIIKMGDLWAYTEAMSADNIPYRKYTARPQVLTDTFGGGGMGGRGGLPLQCQGRDQTVWSMGLFGEFFWYVLDRDTSIKSAAQPTAVEVLHPAFMDVKAKKTGGVEYVYGSGSNKTTLDPDDVIHVRYKSLPTSRRALSPVTYASVAGALAMAAYEFGSTWFSQGQSPSVFFTTDQKLGREETERIAQKYVIEHAGLPASHLPVVLDSGLKPNPRMSTPDEAQFLKTLEFGRTVLADWFGLPAAWLTNSEQRTPSKAPHTNEEETQWFVQNTLSGYMVPLEEAHSGMLPAGEFAAFNENALSRPDAQFLAQLIQAMRLTQAASINDVRTRYLGWAPVDDARADDPIQPLASNVAPSQTDTSKSDTEGGHEPPPKGEAE